MLVAAPVAADSASRPCYSVDMGHPPLTDYEKYIRTEELLALQKGADKLSCHDELQFQIVHQVAELWMKLIEHEILFAAAKLREGHTARALRALSRVRGIQSLLDGSAGAARHDGAARLHDHPQRARSRLGAGVAGLPAHAAAPRARSGPRSRRSWPRAAVTLRQIYEQPDAHPELFNVAEALVDYDQNLQSWRMRHLLLVYRQIGVGTPSLKGKPSDLLAEGMKHRFFPALWSVRDELFAEWTRTHPYGADKATTAERRRCCDRDVMSGQRAEGFRTRERAQRAGRQPSEAD